MKSIRSRTGKESLPDYGFYGNFGGINMGEPPHIDAMLMPTLNAALAQLPIALDEAFYQRRLLPHSVGSALNMARFLSFALLSARTAQADFGIRSSILLADAHHLRGGWMDKFIGDSNDVFKTGRRFVNITDSFMDRAHALRKNRQFQAVMRSMGDPAECLKQLGCCELWNKLQRFDRVSTIAQHGLMECDVLPDLRALVDSQF